MLKSRLMAKQNNTFYFRHDFNASDDPKIVYLQDKFGDVAYSWYFKTLELLASQHCSLELNKINKFALQKKLNIDQDKLETYLETCFEIGLFRLNLGLYIESERLLKDQNLRDKRSETSAINGRSGGRPPKNQQAQELTDYSQKPNNNLNEKPNKPNQKPIAQERRVEESLVEERKENKKENPPLSGDADNIGIFDPTPEELEREKKILSITPNSNSGFRKAKIPDHIVKRIK
jgi:hypothetical protein